MLFGYNKKKKKYSTLIFCSLLIFLDVGWSVFNYCTENNKKENKPLFIYPVAVEFQVIENPFANQSDQNFEPNSSSIHIGDESGS